MKPLVCEGSQPSMSTEACVWDANQQVFIRVLDVDEPPVFTNASYHFTVLEETMTSLIGSVRATDPDRPQKKIR